MSPDFDNDTLVVHPDARLDYVFSTPITEFRATVLHGAKTGGNGVEFEVKAGDRSVYSSRTLEPGEQQDDDVP